MKFRFGLRFVMVALLVASCGTSAVRSGSSGTQPPGTLSAATPTSTARKPAPDVANRALTEGARALGRSDPAVCLYVDPSTGIDASAALASLQGTIDILVRQGYGALGTRPAASCPGEPLFIRTDTVHPKNSGNGPVAPLPRVTTPGPFQLHIAITTPTHLARIFGGSTIRRGAEEMTCSDHDCAEVTGSIYVDATTFASGTERERLLFEGLGLLGG
jgi:hypothetical protein